MGFFVSLLAGAMLDRVPPFLDRTFGRLAADPRLLFAVCLAANAVFLPYRGLYHDAALYAAQAVNAVDGRFADDLFFKYGSQARFTLFPAAVGWLVVGVGPDAAFFALYLLSTVARIAALQALANRLFGRTSATAAGLLLASLSAVPVGPDAWPAFSVNETYFTARPPAFALALFGLERAVAGRWPAAAGLLAGAAALHPLIAAPAIAVAVAAGVWGWASTPGRRVVAGAAACTVAAAAAGVWLAAPHDLDDEWKRAAVARARHLDLSYWETTDFVRLEAAAAAALLAAGVAGRAARRVLIAVVAVAAAGLLAAFVVHRGTWALPFQAQPFRGVWPLEALARPAACAAAAAVWGRGPGWRATAVVLLAALLAAPSLVTVDARLMLGEAVLAAAAVSVVGAFGRGPDRWWKAVAAGVAGWAVVWYGVLTPRDVADAFRGGVMLDRPVRERAWAFLFDWGAIPRMAAAVAAVAVLLPGGRRGVVVALAVAVAATVGWIVTSPPDRDERSVPFVRREVAARWAGDGLPTVYWPTDRVELVWFGVGAKSYFRLSQLSGALFNRATEGEGMRRTDVVRPFELELEARDAALGGDPATLARFGRPTAAPTPTDADFARLVADPLIDFAVLPRDYGGAVATDGWVWVYDVRVMRGEPEPR